MFKHYLTTAMRYFRQHRVTTSINVICLSLGIICFVLAWGTTLYFAQNDQHHAKASRTYIVSSKFSNPQITAPTTPWLLGETLRTDFSQLEHVARVLPQADIPMVANGESRLVAVAYVDPEMLSVFDLPIIHGDARHALDQPRSAVVSVSMARKLFGTDDVVGRTLRFAGRDETVTIRGVVGEINAPSHISTSDKSPTKMYIEAAISMDVGAAMLRAVNPNGAKNTLENWDSTTTFTYVVVPSNGSMTADNLNDQLEAFKQRHLTKDEQRSVRFVARPSSDFMALAFDAMAGTDRTGIPGAVVIATLGGLVLLVACLNYANLASAQAIARAKEIALQKVVGANGRQIIAQYLVEGALLTGASLLLSIALLALLSLPSGMQAVETVATLPEFWAVLAALLIVVTLLAGSYPALILSRVRPAQALRTGRVKGRSSLASTLLMGVQFGSASFLIIAVFAMSTENAAIRHAIWDQSSDPIIVIGGNSAIPKSDIDILKTELRRTEGVSSVTGSQFPLWGTAGRMNNLSVTDSSHATQVVANEFVVDFNFFDTTRIPLLAGRLFDKERASDLSDLSAWTQRGSASNAEFAAIVSEQLARRLGFATTSAAVDRVIYNPIEGQPSQRLRIIGVVPDAALRPLDFGASGSFYLLDPTLASIPVVRISKNNVAATLASIDRTWRRLYPEVPIQRHFADEQFEAAFAFLNAIRDAFFFLSAFASIIAVMGLVGMTLHVIAHRTHEIGVRKTLGASVQQILWLLIRSFSKPVVIANLAVWPLIYVVMQGYMSLFAVRSTLTFAPFVLSLVITLAIAWLAVIAQATKAARLNPATVLRYE